MKICSAKSLLSPLEKKQKRNWMKSTSYSWICLPVRSQKTHLRNAFRELLYLVGNRNDPCFVADFFPDGNECTYYKKCVESEVIGLIHSFSSIAFLAARNFTPSFRKFGFNPYFVIPKSRDAWSEFGSFAAFLTLSLLSDPNELFFRVATVLKQHGVKYVIDSSAGTDIALIESREEFLHRYVIVFHAFLTLINPLPLLDIEKEWVLHG